MIVKYGLFLPAMNVRRSLFSKKNNFGNVCGSIIYYRKPCVYKT